MIRLSLFAILFLIACTHKPTPKTGPVEIDSATSVPHNPATEDGGKWFSGRWHPPIIYFQFDRADINPNLLHVYADSLEGQCVVVGHASEEGSTEYNMALGSRRADAVRAYLEASCARAHLESISYGEEKPVTHDLTEYWKNRRVEIHCK